MAPPASAAPRGVRSVLFVCTGNICRSPAAELLLRSGLGADAGIAVSSAGLDASSGAAVDPAMSRILEAHGVDPQGFRARQLQSVHAAEADLVLTMTAEQRAAVVTTAPMAVRRTFTLLEFAELAAMTGQEAVGATPAERLAALVGAAPRARARRAPLRGSDDVEDPYRRSDEVFARVFAIVEEAVRGLTGVLGTTAPVTGRPGPVAVSGELPGQRVTESSGRWSTRQARRQVAAHGGGTSWVV
jgi:protein-tyrosine phosphatase